MDPKIKKTIELMKRAYDQPILFHILHGHLSFLMQKATPAYEMVDDWSKILVLSCHPNKMPNQGLETKIQQFLNKNRPPLLTSDQKLKLMCVCYYFLNRQPSLMNHIALFELVSSYLGLVSDYFDGMIINLLNKTILCRIFEMEENRKNSASSIEKMISILKERTLSDANKAKAIPCFINSDISPFSMSHASIQPSYLGYKYLESICLYAKYTANTSYLQEILPSSEHFLEDLRRFMSFSFEFDSTPRLDLSKCLVQDNSTFKKIKEEFDGAEDKHLYVSKLIEYISSLNQD